MVGCWMLKRLDQLGDETLMERWIENPTMPYFTGFDFMNHQPPWDPSDWSPIRKRMGRKDLYLFRPIASKGNQEVLIDGVIRYHRAREPCEVSDRCQMEQKTIDQCHKIAKKEKIQQRQTDAKASKELLRQTFHGKPPRRAQKAKKATSKLKTLAGRPVRE